MIDLAQTERGAVEAVNEQLIGEVAGVIWRELAAQGESSPLALAERLSISPELVCLGIGSLAREAKLNFADNAYGCAIRLR